MSDEIAALILAIKSDQFETGLRRSESLTNRLADSEERLIGQTGRLSATLKHAGAALVSLYAGSKVVGMLRDATAAASAFREDLAQFRHVMRNVRTESEAMLKTLQSDAYGRTAQQAMRMTMTVTSMAKGMGLADDAALRLSGDFAKLSIDIGSFLAKDPDSVMDAFTSGMMGNAMALKQYGIYVTEAALSEEIAANAKRGLVYATEREARAYALLTLAQRQQADAIGDFAVESEGYSNQVKKLGGGLKELQVKFGSSLLEPARLAAIEINKFVDALNRMDETTFAVISGVTVLGTAAAGLYGAIKIGAGVIAASNAIHAIAASTSQESTVARTAEAVASGTLTTAMAAETAAITANTVARRANAATNAAGAAAPALRKMSKKEEKALNALSFGEDLPGKAGGKATSIARTGQAIAVLSKAEKASASISRQMEKVGKSTEKYAALSKAKAVADRKIEIAGRLGSKENAPGGFAAFSRRVDEIAAGQTAAAGKEAWAKASIRERVLANIAESKAARTGKAASQAVAFDMDGFLSKGTREHQRHLAVKTADRLRKQMKGGVGVSDIVDAASTVDLSKYMSPKTKLGRAGAALNYTGVGNLASFGKNGDMISKMAGSLFKMPKTLSGSFGYLNKHLTTLSTSLLRGVPLLGRFAPLLGTLIGPLGAVAGMAAGIYAGIKAIKAAPMALEWVLDKLGHLFTFEGLKNAVAGAATGLAKGTWGAVKAVAQQGGEMLYAGGQLLLRGVGQFTGVKTQTQILYEQQKKIAEVEKALNKRREENAKREGIIQAARVAAAETEEKWADIQKRVLEKRNSVAFDTFDETAREDFYRRELESMQSGVLGFEQNQSRLAGAVKNAAMRKAEANAATVDIDEDDPARKRFNKLMERTRGDVVEVERRVGAQSKGWTGYSYEHDDKTREKVQRLAAAKRADDAFARINEGYSVRMQRYGEAKIASLDIEAKLRQAELDAVANMPDHSERIAAYQKLYDQAKSSAIGMLGGQDVGSMQDDWRRAQSEVDKLQKMHDREQETNGQSAALQSVKDQLEAAEKRRDAIGRELNTLHSHLSLARRAQKEEERAREELERIETDRVRAEKDRYEKHKKANEDLFEFKYSIASKPEQQRMATDEFNRIHGELGRTSDPLKREALTEDLKKVFARLEKDAPQGPAWHGVKSNTTSAVEATSVQAREMENRVWNEMDTLVGLTKQQLEINRKMLEALEANAQAEHFISLDSTSS